VVAPASPQASAGGPACLKTPDGGNAQAKVCAAAPHAGQRSGLDIRSMSPSSAGPFYNCMAFARPPSARAL